MARRNFLQVLRIRLYQNRVILSHTRILVEHLETKWNQTLTNGDAYDKKSILCTKTIFKRAINRSNTINVKWWDSDLWHKTFRKGKSPGTGLKIQMTSMEFSLGSWLTSSGTHSNNWYHITLLLKSQW